MGQPAKSFVVFSEIKKAVSIKDILDHYGLMDTFTQKGSSLIGSCPIHRGESRTQFKAETEKNCWYCFGNCQRGGNILDLVSLVEGVSIRDGALLISDWFGLKNSNGAKGKKEAKPEPTQKKHKKEEPKEEKGFNPPLKFSGLKNLDPEHEFLTQRGFSKETVGYFEAGYFSGKGVMHDHVAIPIHNLNGLLVGYAGRQVSEGPAVYKFPKNFRTELEVYNLHRVQESWKKLGFLFVVPEFFDVWRMHEAEFPNTISLMGEFPSKDQFDLLLSPQVEEGEREQRALWILTYNDLDSQEELEVLASLSKKFFVKIMQFDSSISEMDPEEIKKIIDRS